MIGQSLSHYTIVEELGRGGMGVVYKAEDTRLGRTVAIKILPDEMARDRQAVERFQREARAASGLSHPHICAVHDVGEHHGRFFIVMELLEGRPLNQQLASGPLPVERIVELGLEIADALEAAHAKGVVHRDIKPANVFITETGHAKLLDFGLAMPGGAVDGRGDATTLGALTSPGAVLGTVAYMSPEQVRGEPLDARTDLFSLGALLYEMASGRRAFPGRTSGSVQEAVLNRAPLSVARLNPELPVRLEEIIDKALEKDRKLRYQRASDLRADLQRLKRDIDSARGVLAAGPGPRPGVSPTSRRNVLVLIVSAAVAVAAAAVGYVRFRTPPDAIDSIAVLPFVNVDGAPDSEYLSDGITESLINNMSQLRSLRVSARSTVFRYKGKESDPQKIGQELGVHAVLAGRLLQRDGRLIVRTELIDVSNGAQLWGQEYNRPFAGIFALQEELAGEISEKLRLRLTVEERQQLTRRYTADPLAYELYLRGRYHWNRRNVQDIPKAIDYFNQSIARDPGYALAYAGLADAYNTASFFNTSTPRDVMPRATAAASKALEIDPRLAQAHISLAYVSLTYEWDWAAATSHFDQALALNASAVENHPFYPLYLTVGRRPADAIRVAERALANDPLSAALSHSLAVQLALARKHDAAIAECRHTIELDPSFAVAYEVMAASYAAKGMVREALPLIEKASGLSPGNAISLALLGYIHANLGQTREARGILERLTALSRERYIPALAFAVVHVGIEERDEAFAWLEKAYAERSNRLAYLGLEPTWDRLRSDPRLGSLLRRIGLPQ
jgi:serine/threonine protein kinase/Tfp pilus assembly protein PilF